MRSIDINGRREISAEARYHCSFWAIVQGERFSVTYIKADRVKKCVSCFATIDVTMKVRNDEMTIRADSKSKSGILFGYCAKSNGIK